MKTYILLFSKPLLLVLIIAINLLAQSESSAIKEISPGDVHVTEPMIAVNPTNPNNFIAVYSNWYGINRRPASSNTIDGGLSWNSTEVPVNLLKYPFDQADPVVTFDADGNAYYCYLDMGDYRDISVAHSTDGGASWTDTSRAYDDFLQQINGFPKPDKPWIVADCNSNSSFKNTLYVVFTAEYELSNSTGYAIFLTYKRPNMPYFIKPIRVCETVIQSDGHDVQGAFPVVGKDGTLYIFWSLESPPTTPTSGYGPASIFMRKSTNGGASFTTSQPVLIKSNITESQGVISFQKAHSWPYVAVNPVDGSLNLVYGDGNTIKYSVSTDKGASWSTSAQKGMKLSWIDAIWNPNITCNSDGKLAVVYYASNSSGIKVYVATGFSSDEEFTVWNQGSVNFSSPYKYTDYIGIACNDYTYWGVWPAPYLPTSKSKIFGRHRTVSPIIENLDQGYLTFTSDKIIFDGNTYASSYNPQDLFPGEEHSLQTYSNSLTKDGSTYTFYRWEDENGDLISTDSQKDVKIDKHRYRAMFAYVPPPPPQYVNVNIKNEFKDPSGTTNNGGTVNIDNEDYEHTENLPGQQVTETYLKNSVHLFEAKEQVYPVGSYYRGFNPRSEYDGGWVYPDLITRRYESIIQPTVTINNGTYLAKYRNKYSAYVNGFAPESNSSISNISPSKQIWQYESDYIFAPPTQTFSSGLTGAFTYWNDGENLITRLVSLNNNSTYTALYKFSNRSNTSSAYSFNNQTRFLKTPNGHLHNVYESLNTVWYERSTDNGVNWQIMNGGLPLTFNIGALNAKSPSISSSNDSDNPQIYITYQVDNFGGYNEDYVVVSQLFNGNHNWTEIVSDNKIDYNYDTKPIVTGLLGFCLVLYKPASNAAFFIKEYGISTTTNNIISATQRTLPSSCVDGSSVLPAITNGSGKYHLAYQYGASQIRYLRWSVNSNPVSTYNYSIPSTNSGYSLNTEPVISLANYNPVISWKGAQYTGTREAVLRRGSISGSTVTWGDFLKTGSSVNYIHNNSANNSTEKTVMTWSQDGSVTKWIKRTYPVNGATQYSTSANLSHGGINVQVTAGTDYNNMKANIFRYSSPLYFFTQSTTDFSVLQEQGGELNKIATDDTILTFGRSGILDINGIEFVFNIGDVMVDDSIITFVEKPDTIYYQTSAALNQHTKTKNFTLTPSTNFYFSNIYYVVTKSDPDTALSTTDAVNFKAELVNSTTNQVVGTFDNIIYNKSNLEKYASIDYQVDCSGITPGDYYLRLLTTINTDAGYALANIVSDNTTLAKKNFNKVNFTGSEIPITYDLEQNFPNPFNPSTTIRYQIPQDGIVTLKIYDILGAEVKTLVNEEKIAGKYEVNFNASSLASGVYIYKIQSGAFISSKKMILLK